MVATDPDERSGNHGPLAGACSATAANEDEDADVLLKSSLEQEMPTQGMEARDAEAVGRSGGAPPLKDSRSESRAVHPFTTLRRRAPFSRSRRSDGAGRWRAGARG